MAAASEPEPDSGVVVPVVPVNSDGDGVPNDRDQCPGTPAGAKVDITGFADSRGPESYNMKLSERRAEAVREYLEQAGLDAERLSARGYGESHDGASDLSANGLAESRRVALRAKDR